MENGDGQRVCRARGAGPGWSAGMLAALLLAPAASAQPPSQWLVTNELADRMVAGKQRALTEAARSPWWIGDPAPLFVSISREIYDVGGETGDESWLMFSCSADSPGDSNTGFWAARLELLLFDASGRLIYASENDEDNASAGGLCAFGSLETWLDDELITMSFIEFPRELEPFSATIYVSSEEQSEVRLLTNASSTVYRPVEEAP